MTDLLFLNIGKALININSKVDWIQQETPLKPINKIFIIKEFFIVN